MYAKLEVKDEERRNENHVSTKLYEKQNLNHAILLGSTYIVNMFIMMSNLRENQRDEKKRFSTLLYYDLR